MHQILQWIMDSIREHGAWSVVVGVLIESVIVPLPSPLIIMGAGFILVPPGPLSWDVFRAIVFQIVLPGSLASTVGALLCYVPAYWGGKVLLTRYQRWVGFSWEDVQNIERRMKDQGIKASLFFLRAIPVIPLSLISGASGVMNIPWKMFLVWTFLGSLPRCFVLAFLGWWIGDTYHLLAGKLNRWEGLISAVFLALILVGLFYMRQRTRRNVLANQKPED